MTKQRKRSAKKSVPGTMESNKRSPDNTALAGQDEPNPTPEVAPGPQADPEHPLDQNPPV